MFSSRLISERLALACSLRRFEASVGLVARRGFGRHGGAADQIDKPGEGFGAIALLLAEALRLYNKHAVIVHAPAGEAPQAGKEIWFNRGRAGRIEAQLDRGRQLVDVLPAGPGGADEALGEFALVDRQGRGDLNHGGQSSGTAGA